MFRSDFSSFLEVLFLPLSAAKKYEICKYSDFVLFLKIKANYGLFGTFKTPEKIAHNTYYAQLLIGWRFYM